MLNITIMRGDNGQEAVLKLPGPYDESEETLSTLEAIRSRDVTTAIISADTSIERLDGILPGMEIDEQELNELEFLARRIGGLCGGERVALTGALELEKPQSLRDIVNLTCNLHKYKLTPGFKDEETMGRHLLKERGIHVPDSIADCVAYDQVANGYLADHPGVFTDSGFVSRNGERLEMVYDGKNLPEPYCDPDGVITVRLNPKGKPNRVTLTFPASCERIDAALEELGVESFDECYASCTSSIPGLLEHLPNYDGLECLNLAAAYLGADEEQNRLFMAVMEAEVPGSMFELPEITDALCQYRLLPEIKTPEDYAHHVLAEDGDRYYVDGFTADFVDFDALGKAMMKENGVALTSFGIVERYDRYIRQLPEELTTLRLFSPLYPQVFTRDEYGDLNWEPEEMSAHELCDYQDEILEAIEKNRLDTEGDRGLAVYLRNALLGRKVYGMNPTVEEWDGRPWGVLEVQTRGELSEGELRELTEEWSGQCSDGWGEGFEQREIKIDQGELNVSFWHSGGDFVIQPEAELKSQPEQRPGMTMQ
ncbi:hypothetical protein RWV98_00280 [Agathobaculum sp. NTUH-O15-33]|uniref:hypothetical protein n=1 Tax=Agathobaculum sp. NTUH-O15-33 TaxID=3079302 RepID=UPI002958AA97|nr:hypothetical protein [Agathobaculum sp. NTUH-O15-33]WNX84744.1 hypothetical protein RWV98_00280 [Agathobaculum sp. NTUH-O15-33]